MHISAAAAQGLLLGALIPAGLDQLLPRLQQLRVENCSLSLHASGNAICTDLGRLLHVEVDAMENSSDEEQTVQLMQLGALPSLSSLTLLHQPCPTLCLVTLASRLTSLRLDASYRVLNPGTLTPTAGWRATLQHVARCTRLEQLTIPCATREELAAAAPALARLRWLHLNAAHRHGHDSLGGDALVEQLLGLPGVPGILQRPHDTPSSLRELRLQCMSLRQLARLPLRSLTSKLEWEVLLVDQHTTASDVHAAVANMSQAPQWSWRYDGDGFARLQFLAAPGDAAFTRGAAEGGTPAALLRALQPLLRHVGMLAVSGLAWDTGVVQVLGEVLSRSCTRLHLAGGGPMPVAACLEVVRSLPWVESLRLCQVGAQPHAVTLLVGAVQGFGLAGVAQAGGGGGPAAPRLADVTVHILEDEEGNAEEDVVPWEEARGVVASLGACVRLEVSRRLSGGDGWL